MGFTHSPLRYPGGKTRLANFVEVLLDSNGLVGGAYVETYAGAAGIAWRLLIDGFISEVYINDVDQALYAFWRLVFDDSKGLCQRIKHEPITMANWHRQKAILDHPEAYSQEELGFATFFLNRTNRSGILRGGVIGGQQQDGDYKLNARFNRIELIERIRRIAAFRGQVHIFGLDAANFITKILPAVPKRSLAYFDPPYFEKGSGLYENHYGLDDHTAIAKLVTRKVKQKWIVSYDNQDAIANLYEGRRRIAYSLTYSAGDRYAGQELLIFSDDIVFPAIKTPIGIKAPKKEPESTQLELAV